ncbi:MAG TPA: GNAT family N-acetyltransferase [Oscillatoriaceae cyanobacterium]
MSIRVRHFTPEDSQSFVDVYNQARPIEIAQLTEDRFWGWFSDPALDACRDVWVAEDADGLLGGVVAFPWPGHLSEGYVFFVGPSVLPEFQRHGVGDRLMSAMLEELASRYPGKRLQTRLHPNNTRAQAFLSKLGFVVDRRFWTMTHAAPGRVQAGEPPAGFRFEYLQPGSDPSEAIALYRRILDDPLASHHLLDADELRAWASLQKFTANSFLIAKAGGEVIGLCFQTFPPGGEFGQVQFLGVLPAYRGRGVASYMLKLALENAHANGRLAVRLETTGKSEQEQTLYKQLGFEVTDGEIFYERPLSEPVTPHA